MIDNSAYRDGPAFLTARSAPIAMSISGMVLNDQAKGGRETRNRSLQLTAVLSARPQAATVPQRKSSDFARDMPT